VTLAEEEIQILGERQFEPEDLQTLHKIVLSFIERLLVDGKDKPLNYLIPRAVYRVLYPNNRELDSQVRFAMYMDHTAGGERFRLWVVETIGIVDVIYRHLARAVSENILKGDDATFLPGYERFVRRSNVPSEAYLYGRIPRSALGGTTVVVGPGTDTRAIDAALDRGEYVIVIEQVKAATAFLRGRYGKTIEYIEEDATKEGAWWSIQADLVISPYVFINEGEMKVALQHIRTGGAFVAAMTAMGPQRASDLFPLIGMGEKMEIVWDFFGSPVMETKTSVKYPSGIHTFIAVKGLDLGVDFAGMRSPEITRRSEERRNARLARMRMTELPLGDVEEIDITPLEARRQFKVKRDRFTKIWASYMSQKKLPAIGDVHNHVIGLKTLVLSIQKRILLSQSERRADWREWRAMEDRIDAKGLIRMIDSFLDEIQSRYLFL